MMQYLNQYRTHLCAVAASNRREQGLSIGRSLRVIKDGSLRSPPRGHARRARGLSGPTRRADRAAQA